MLWPSYHLFDVENAVVLVMAVISWLNCFFPSLRLGPKKWPQVWALFWTVGPLFQVLCLVNLFNFQMILIDAAWLLAIMLLTSVIFRLFFCACRRRNQRVRRVQGQARPQVTVESK